MKTIILTLGAFVAFTFAAYMVHSAIDAATIASAKRAAILHSLGQ